MKHKFLNAEFGYCPRVLCDRQIVIPVAMSEDLSISRVKVYCPKCEDVYVPYIHLYLPYQLHLVSIEP